MCLGKSQAYTRRLTREREGRDGRDGQPCGPNTTRPESTDTWSRRGAMRQRLCHKKTSTRSNLQIDGSRCLSVAGLAHIDGRTFT